MSRTILAMSTKRCDRCAALARAAKPSPAFSFYPNDWLGEAKLLVLSGGEEAAYLRLLLHCWKEDGLPSDPARLVRLTANKLGPGDSIEEVVKMFHPCACDPPRLFHPRLDVERRKQASRSASQARKARMRWDNEEPPSDAVAPAAAYAAASPAASRGHMPNACPSSSSSSSSSSPVSSPVSSPQSTEHRVLEPVPGSGLCDDGEDAAAQPPPTPSKKGTRKKKSPEEPDPLLEPIRDFRARWLAMWARHAENVPEGATEQVLRGLAGWAQVENALLRTTIKRLGPEEARMRATRWWHGEHWTASRNPSAMLSFRTFARHVDELVEIRKEHKPRGRGDRGIADLLDLTREMKDDDHEQD